MAQIEYPVWIVTRSVLAMPFRCLRALLKYGLLPLLIATVCLPPPINLATNTEITVDGESTATPTSENQSLTDGELGWRDLIGFLLMLPFAAAFAAAWCRLTATGAEWEMGRAPIAFDARTIGVIWAFLRLTFVALGILLLLFILSLAFFGSYHDGTLSFSYSVSVDADGAAPTLLAMAAMLAGFLVFAWFMLRLALIIPASAMGEPISLRQSWRMSAPVHLRMLGTTTLLALAYLVLNILFLLAMVLLIPVVGIQGAFYATVALYFILLVYGHAIWAGFLGATYGLLHQQDRGPDVSSVFA
jgi:hypothetical protein